MEVFVLSFTAFIVAILTFFSGFGLGTILTPVFMLYFPVDMAIALTGVVHFFNNLFKIALVGRHADKAVLIRFGAPAIIAALVGSWLMLQMIDFPPLLSYQWRGDTIDVYPMKFVVAILLMVFALIELLPYFNKLQFGKDKLPIGGVLSGFFGGLTGNQGALRSAFLIRVGLSKEAFIGTAVVVSTLVDFTRLSMYATRFQETSLWQSWPVVLCATSAGILGAWLGNKLLKKVTLRFLQILIGILLIILSCCLALGIL